MVQTQERSPLEVVPSHPKGWLSLSLRVRSKAHFISDWDIVLLSAHCEPALHGCKRRDVLKMLQHVDKQSLYSFPEYLPFLEHKFDFGSSLPWLPCLKAASIEKREIVR